MTISAGLCTVLSTDKQRSMRQQPAGLQPSCRNKPFNGLLSAGIGHLEQRELHCETSFAMVVKLETVCASSTPLYSLI